MADLEDSCLLVDEIAKLPLRLIDVEATIGKSKRGGLCFTRQQTWHIISHTWSIYIQNLSITIGQKLRAAKCSTSYEALFESANFMDEGYQALMEFLMILKSDGVRWVWLDALCINQTDEEEKNREIGQMGSYYETSLGCYVVQHGFGGGYRLLQDDDGGINWKSMAALPRWFSRVWTFQEWILPKKVTFIVEGLDQILLRVAGSLLLASDSVCCCCYCEQSFEPRALERYKVSSAFEPVYLNLVSMPCSEGPHFRKFPGVESGGGQYLVDDAGYLFLIRVARALHRDYENKKEAFDEFVFQQRLQQRMRFQGVITGTPTSPEMLMHLAIEEISRRDCTNEEDRVLAILKVLGVEGAVQVRTGKKLYEQLIQVAKDLVDKNLQEEVLVRMCLVDGWGNEKPGMSWAPTFAVGPNTRQEGTAKLAYRWSDGYFERFECGARVRGVSQDNGALLLDTLVIPGCLISYEHNVKDETPELESMGWSKEIHHTEMVLQVDVDNGQQVSINLRAYATEDVPHTCILVPVPWYINGQGSIVLSAMGLHDHLHHCRMLDGVPLWLLKMGQGYINGDWNKNDVASNKKKSLTYFLVCVGKQGGPFHKVGYIAIFSKLLTSNKTPTTICSIDGFGGDLSAYISPLQANALQEGSII